MVRIKHEFQFLFGTAHYSHKNGMHKMGEHKDQMSKADDCTCPREPDVLCTKAAKSGTDKRTKN